MNNSLKNKALISKLFVHGKTLSSGNLLIKFLESDKPEVLVTVSTKRFPRAVDRNRIKRLMREAISKVSLPNKAIAIIYVGNDIPSLEDIKLNLSKIVF